MPLALKVAGFLWTNRNGIMNLYHHVVKHKVLVDDIIGYASEHPDHPMNKSTEEK